MPKNFNFFSVVVNLTKLVSGDKSTFADELELPQSATTPLASSDNLDRIASALERIATALEKQNATPVKKDDISRITDNTSTNKLPIESTNSKFAQPQVNPANNGKKDDISRTTRNALTNEGAKPPIEPPSSQMKIDKVNPISEKPTNPLSLAVKEKTLIAEYLEKQDLARSPLQSSIAPLSKVVPVVNNPKTVYPSTNLTTSANNQTKNVIKNYLALHNITIIKEGQQPQAELKEVAIYLGQYFATCEGLYKTLKDNLNAKPPRQVLTYRVSTIQEQIELAGFCELLEKAGLVDEIIYTKVPPYDLKLKVKVQGKNKERHYINGPWLETYIQYQVEKITKAYADKQSRIYDSSLNPHLNIGTELDLLFSVDEQIFCVEAKTNTTLAKLKDFVEKAALLKLKNENILIVIAEKSEEECLKLAHDLNGVRIIPIANFKKVLRSLVK